MIRKATQTPAAAYIRMSGSQQDKSPAEQRAEITKLAAREGCVIAPEHWFKDEAITGDSGSDERPGLAKLLAAAKAGRFKVLFAWHTNRISREDPMEAIGTYNLLRKAGVSLYTFSEGAIDLEDFPKQLLLFVGQKANNDFLTELSAKSLRGRIAKAKTGECNGGPAPYAMDRAEFDSSGQLLQRLRPGDRTTNKRNPLRLIPCEDSRKLEAVRYAFERFDSAHLSKRQLARELQLLGYPSPSPRPWTRDQVDRILTNPVYAGVVQWGTRAAGAYYEARADDVVRRDKTREKGKARKKPAKDAIAVADATEAIVPIDVFQRVRRKATSTRRTRHWRTNDSYPLSGLLVCARCGRKMVARTVRQKNRKAEPWYTYQSYVCATYKEYGPPICGHNIISAERVLKWVVYKLKETYLGPGRELLTETIAAKLQTGSKRKDTDGERLQKRSQELDRQIKRLVVAIRTMDAPELVQELTHAKKERKDLQAELDSAAQRQEKKPAETDAQQIAGELRRLRRLTAKDPATLREVLHRFVAKIECRWTVKPGKYRRYPLERVKIQLRDSTRPMTATACVMPPCPDVVSGLLTFEIAADAEPADCADALADLLISIKETKEGTAPNDPK